jgi:hypothetical protein
MSLKKTSAVFFLLAVFCRIFYIFLFPPQGTDHQMIHTAVDNLLSGNGLRFPIANPQDLSATVYQPMNEWPPLIAYILSVVKAIVGSAYAADMILMITGMVFLLLVLRALMNVLNLKLAVQSIIWLLIATNPELFHTLGLTDLYGGLFILWSVLFCIRFIQNPVIPTFQLIVASVFFFLPAAFRYQYYPIIFISPLFLIIAGKLLNQKSLYQKGILSVSVVFFMLSFQVFTLYQQTGMAATIADDAKGFFPENLIWTYPFLLKGFINISYIENTMIGLARWMIIPYYILTLLFSLFLIFKLASYLIRKTRIEIKFTEEDSINTKSLVRSFLLVVASSIVVLLMGLSLRYSPQVSANGLFTYVNESRYYLASSLLFGLLLAGLLQDELSFAFIKKFQFGKRIVAGVVVFNLALFGKFLFNATTDNLPDPNVRAVAERKIVYDEIELLKEKHHLPVIAAASSRYFSYQPVLQEFAVVKNLKQLMQYGIKTSQPVQLLIITSAKPNEEELSFVQQKGATEIFSGRKCRMYHLIIGNTQQVASVY